MPEKQYRELKFSSPQLVVVFLAVIALGAFIFLLGISVGKRQPRLMSGRDAAAQGEAEIVIQKQGQAAETGGSVRQGEASAASNQVGESKSRATPQPETKGSIAAGKTGEAKVLSSRAAPVEKKTAEARPEDKTAVSPAGTAAGATPPAGSQRKQEGIFYVQIAAIGDKAGAFALSNRIEKEGYPVLVLEPRPNEKKIYYRVRIGPYDTKSAAQDAQTRIADVLKKNKSTFFLVKG